MRMRWVIFLSMLTGTLSAQSYPEDFTLENIWRNYAYYTPSNPGLTWTPDDQLSELVQSDSGVCLIEYPPMYADRQAVVLCENEIGWKGDNPNRLADYRYTSDSSLILLTSQEESIYRYSSRAVYHLFNRVTNQVYAVNDGHKCMYPLLSPEGDQIAFVAQNNIYVQGVGDTVIRPITKNGEITKIINGASDWVYEEEFELTRAYEWSPDGQYLAYLQFDESEVKAFNMTMYDSLYPYPYTFKYPKAGEDNAKVKLFCYGFEADTTFQMDVSAYEYVPRIAWRPGTSELTYQTMNRLQNKWELRSWNVVTGQSSTLLRDSSETYVSLHSELRFVNTDTVLWIGEENGWSQLMLTDLRDGLHRAITPTEVNVEEILNIKKRSVTIQVKDNALQSATTQLKITDTYSTDTNFSCYTSSGSTYAAEAPNGMYSLSTNTGLNSAPDVRIHGSLEEAFWDSLLIDGQQFNQQHPSFVANPKTFIEIPLPDGEVLNAWMLKPAHFKKRKSYPLIITQYSGPGSQSVKDQWSGTNHIMHHYLASQGYVVVGVDPRGTGGRGTAFKNCTYKQLGVQEADDLIAAAKHLGTMKFIDAENIGIYGWSYGGTMAARCALVGGKTFKAAFSVAPVTDWKFYDTIYTERYMQTPQDNTEGYAAASLLNKAHLLETSLFLVHGTGDDNVHVQNTYALAAALTAENKPFEMKIYPDKNHGIYGGYTRVHLFQTMVDYFERELK